MKQKNISTKPLFFNSKKRGVTPEGKIVFFDKKCIFEGEGLYKYNFFLELGKVNIALNPKKIDFLPIKECDIGKILSTISISEVDLGMTRNGYTVTLLLLEGEIIGFQGAQSVGRRYAEFFFLNTEAGICPYHTHEMLASTRAEVVESVYWETNIQKRVMPIEEIRNKIPYRIKLKLSKSWIEVALFKGMTFIEKLVFDFEEGVFVQDPKVENFRICKSLEETISPLKIKYNFSDDILISAYQVCEMSPKMEEMVSTFKIKVEKIE